MRHVCVCGGGRGNQSGEGRVGMQGGLWVGEGVYVGVVCTARVGQKKQTRTAPGIPKRSPISVLIGPNLPTHWTKLNC